MDVRRLLELAVATFLTAIAGFVDAVGFLSLAKVYTANMSGNSVALGIAISHRDWPTALFRVWPVLLYVSGLVFGRALLAYGARRGARHIAAVAFGCEVLFLLFALLIGSDAPSSIPGRQFLGIALLASAMGIQNSTLTHFSSLTLHTGFVTGTLVKMAEHFVACTTGAIERFRAGQPVLRSLIAADGQKSFRMTLFLAMTWTAYVFGAALGAWGESVSHSRSLFFPIAGLALLIALDLIQPLGREDQQYQAHLRTGA